MESFLGSPGFIIAVWGGAALFALFAALFLISAIVLNKGAKANRAWSFMTLGAVLIGLAAADRLLTHFGMPLLLEWEGVLVASATLLLLLGALSWRHLLKKTLAGHDER